MAFAGRPKVDTDYQQLKSALLNSGLQKKDNTLFGVLVSLIDAASKFKESLSKVIKVGDKLDATLLEGRVPLASGGNRNDKYEPILTLISNLTGAGVDEFYYIQSGSLVTVFGRVQVTPTAINVITELGISLPLISYFSFDYQCAGSGYSPTINQGAAIVADVGNKRAKIKFLASNNVTFDIFFTFGYRIIEKG